MAPWSLRPCFVSVLLVVALLGPRPALAVWPGDPAVNLPICTAAGSQYSPAIVSDGRGGAIIVWSDGRAGNYDIYAQRVSLHGIPQWTSGGVPVCTSTGHQEIPVAVSDGAGGVIVAWQDRRGASPDIYAQQLGPDGVPQWVADGIPVGTATDEQLTPAITSDGAGGAIVAWVDRRTGPAGQIAAQRVVGGAMLWTANGVLLHTYVSGTKSLPNLASDEDGGAIVAWRNDGDNSVRVRHVTSAGSVGWTADGVQLCTSANTDRGAPQLVPDRAGGAIVAWSDSRNPVYAQRLNSSGATQWAANGVALGTGVSAAGVSGAQDGAGGMLVSWASTSAAYAQRVSGAGTLLWNASAVRLVNLTGVSGFTSLAATSGGGAIIAWSRSGIAYAQAVSPLGGILWAPTSTGVTISTGTGARDFAVLTADGTGGAILAWEDRRSGVRDIYAQRVERTGQLPHPQPVITSADDIAGDQGGKVRVEWTASYMDTFPTLGISHYGLWRRVSSATAMTATARGARLLATGESPADVRPGVFRMAPLGAQSLYWEGVGLVAARGEASYTFLAPTLADSTGSGTEWAVFMVDAHAADGSAFWDSAPDSGYSVDNLAPPTPAPFTGRYASGTTALHWGATTAPDFAEYRLYRGASPDFVPSPENHVVSRPDTGYIDSPGSPYFYRLCAVDMHGNISPYAFTQPGGTADLPGPNLPGVAWLGRATPNPMRDECVIHFGLPHQAQGALGIYDPQGRRVRGLLAGTLPAGEQSARWDGRAEDGAPAPSGLYLVRLEVGGRGVTGKLVIVR